LAHDPYHLCALQVWGAGENVDAVKQLTIATYDAIKNGRPLPGAAANNPPGGGAPGANPAPARAPGAK